jgi:hypothetical protein
LCRVLIVSALSDKVNPIESWRKKNPLNDKGLSLFGGGGGNCTYDVNR